MTTLPIKLTPIFLLTCMAFSSTHAMANLSPDTAQPAITQIDTPPIHQSVNQPIPTLGVNLVNTPLLHIPTPNYRIDDIRTIPTHLIAQTTNQDGYFIDSTLIDDFIDDISPNARHYPTNFPNRTTEYHVGQHIAYLLKWIEPFAQKPNASFDVLLRAAKLAIMGRNMGVSEYVMPATNYLNRALALDPNHAEVNFLFGMLLAESGGFKEGKVYLEKAAALGYLEAEQSLIQAELISGDGNHQTALNSLKALHARYPNNTQIAQQINILENGGYYIWKITDNQINIKPLPTTEQ